MREPLARSMMPRVLGAVSVTLQVDRAGSDQAINVRFGLRRSVNRR